MVKYNTSFIWYQLIDFLSICPSSSNAIIISFWRLELLSYSVLLSWSLAFSCLTLLPVVLWKTIPEVVDLITKYILASWCTLVLFPFSCFPGWHIVTYSHAYFVPRTLLVSLSSVITVLDVFSRTCLEQRNGEHMNRKNIWTRKSVNWKITELKTHETVKHVVMKHECLDLILRKFIKNPMFQTGPKGSCTKFSYVDFLQITLFFLQKDWPHFVLLWPLVSMRLWLLWFGQRIMSSRIQVHSNNSNNSFSKSCSDLIFVEMKLCNRGCV